MHHLINCKQYLKLECMLKFVSYNNFTHNSYDMNFNKY